MGVIRVKDLENRCIGYSRRCDLCEESFYVDIHETRTICPECQAAWRKIRDKVLFEESEGERKRENREELAAYVDVQINTLKYRPREDTRDVLIDFLSDFKDFLRQEDESEEE